MIPFEHYLSKITMEDTENDKYRRIHAELKKHVRKDPASFDDPDHDYREEFTAIKTLISLDDLELVKSVFPDLLNPNTVLQCTDWLSKKVMTPLFVALEYSQRKEQNMHIMEYLLNIGADVNHQFTYESISSKRMTRLSLIEYAFFIQHPKAVQLLLEKGVEFPQSALLLQLACFHNNLELLSTVLEQGIYFHTGDIYPLHWALLNPISTESPADFWELNIETHSAFAKGLEKYSAGISLSKRW